LTQKKYKKHNELPFILLADEKGAIAKKFGVPIRPGGEIQVKDPEYTAKRGVTISRWTFIIDKDGKIAYKDTDAKPAQDAKKVLEALDKLGK
jgi:peroxiredoxin Q/BCP